MHGRARGWVHGRSPMPNLPSVPPCLPAQEMAENEQRWAAALRLFAEMDEKLRAAELRAQEAEAALQQVGQGGGRRGVVVHAWGSMACTATCPPSQISAHPSHPLLPTVCDHRVPPAAIGCIGERRLARCAAAPSMPASATAQFDPSPFPSPAGRRRLQRRGSAAAASSSSGRSGAGSAGSGPPGHDCQWGGPVPPALNSACLSLFLPLTCTLAPSVALVTPIALGALARLLAHRRPVRPRPGATLSLFQTNRSAPQDDDCDCSA